MNLQKVRILYHIRHVDCSRCTDSFYKAAGRLEVERLTGSPTHLSAGRTLIESWRGSILQEVHGIRWATPSRAPTDVNAVSASGESGCVQKRVRRRVIWCTQLCGALSTS